MKKKLFLVLVLVLLLLPIQAHGERVEFDTGVDIMFVIDHSLSMQINDPNGMLYEAVKYIATLSEGSQNRIGYVIFNCGIIVEHELQKVHDATDIHEVMERMQRTPALHGTDVGQAMKVAHELLIDSNYRPGYTAMIILSDGDTILEVVNQVRSQEEVERDWEEVLEAVTFPVFTIQYSELGETIEDSYRHTGVMNDWGPRTGGRNYDAVNFQQLLESITDIYSQLAQLSAGMGNVITREGDSGEFILSITIPEGNQQQVAEMQVTLIDSDVIREIILPPHQGELAVRTVGNNSVITITNPLEESYEIRYITTTGEEVMITTLTRMEERELSLEEEMAYDEDVSEEATDSFLTPGQMAMIIGGSIGIILLALLVIYQIRKSLHKKKYRYFKGALECYFMVTPEGTKDIPIQSWSAAVIAGKKSGSLHELLKNISLIKKMPEAAKVFVEIGPENSILIHNKGNVVCYRNGKEEIEKKITLRSGEGVYMVFQKGTLELELRVRRGSL